MSSFLRSALSLPSRSLSGQACFRAAKPLGLFSRGLATKRRRKDKVIDFLPPKMSMMLTVAHHPGSLRQALDQFWKHDINMTRLESRPNQRSSDFDFFVTFEGDAHDKKVNDLIKGLKETCPQVQMLSSREVPWFPTRAMDCDEFASEVLEAGADLEADHPGFHDPVYRARREQLTRIAQEYRHGKAIPKIDYTQDEINTWNAVYNQLMPLYQKHACKEYLDLFPDLEKHCHYAADNIPQLDDISKYLKKRTGFTLRPVAGLLSARNFLYGLAFRIFFSTQYLRHHSKPLYTPEPDICHELLGHVPLFADKDFADFSQELGLAAIGATDEQILQLARCYWFSVEFGLCKQDGERKAYGAGLLSSFGELEYSMSEEPEVVPWDPFDAAQRDYPITTYQPTYYIADSFIDAKKKMKDFSESFQRPFYVRYNAKYESIEVDSAIKILPPQPQN